MIDIKSVIDNSQHNKLEYFNAIGLIFQNQIYLNRNNNLMHYDISDIKRIYFKKERNLKNNYFLFLTAVVIAFSSYSLKTDFGNYTFLGYLLAACFMVYAILKRSHAYRILLITTNHNISSIVISDACKQQATKLVSLIKRKIKDNEQYRRAS